MAQIESKLPPLKDRPMWCLWRDFFTSTRTWRMKTPIGVLPFKTKKAALQAKTLYDKSVVKHVEEGLTLTITIKGKTDGDIEQALDRIKSQVSDGYTTGFDRNESGSYRFDLKGEAK